MRRPESKLVPHFVLGSNAEQCRCRRNKKHPKLGSTDGGERARARTCVRAAAFSPGPRPACCHHPLLPISRSQKAMNIAGRYTRKSELYRLGSQKSFRMQRIPAGSLAVKSIHIGNIELIGAFRPIRVSFIGDIAIVFHRQAGQFCHCFRRQDPFERSDADAVMGCRKIKKCIGFGKCRYEDIATEGGELESCTARAMDPISG